MRPDEPRTFEKPRTIDVTDPDQLQAEAERYEVAPQELAEVVAEVGPNRTAVELKLEAPRV
jgi:hypothetical protein